MINNHKNLKQNIYDPGFDKAYNDVDRHGIPGQTTETHYDPRFDKAYNDADRHGISASYYPDREKFNTNNNDVQEFCKAIINAEEISEKGYEQLGLLPEKALKSIIESRYIKTIDKIENGYSNDFMENQIKTDLELISNMINAGKILYEYDINISNKLGGLDLQNIIGVLNGYESWIQTSKLESASTYLDSINKIREQAISQAEMLGYSSNQKTR